MRIELLGGGKNRDRRIGVGCRVRIWSYNLTLCGTLRGADSSGYVDVFGLTLLPQVHRMASLLLERWLLGTRQRALSRESPDYCLDEFTF